MRGYHWKDITKFALNLICVTTDPWLYYVPEISINGDNQKYRLVPNYKLAFLILIPYPIFIAHRLILRAFECCKDDEGIVKQLISQGVPGITASLLVIILLSSMKNSDTYVFLVVMVPFLILYSVRIYQICKWTTKKLEGHPTCKIWLNLILYLYGGHVFGGMWYSFAIKKRVGCWNNACADSKENCSLVIGKYLQIGYNITNTTYLDDSCTNKNLGIFKDAYDSDIVEIKYKFLVKLVYGFRWGIQNLSGFGQNLQPSIYVWENMFVIFIAVYGVAMFTYFIGNMQVGLRLGSYDFVEKVARAFDDQNNPPLLLICPHPTTMKAAQSSPQNGLVKTVESIEKTEGGDD
uniref:Ion transport domain-containing protein n=1 Tax=Dipteronia dyeriana TaxID=168575 RepID=A0AAE0CKS1_9ROSI|nr:hypothetical protein Ddye_014034 [Dipteronia dyeriana]